MAIITQNDFSCIGDVAKHCNVPKLCTAINESENFDFLPLVCGEFYVDILANLANPLYVNLLNGGSFLGCNGKNDVHFGLKKVLVYYAYSRYIMINQYNDTANGLVQKTNEFSMPTPYKDLLAFSNKYRDMGNDAWQKTLKYLCKNKDTFSKFNSKNCSCDCTDCETCDGKTQNQLGWKVNIIKK